MISLGLSLAYARTEAHIMERTYLGICEVFREVAGVHHRSLLSLNCGVGCAGRDCREPLIVITASSALGGSTRGQP